MRYRWTWLWQRRQLKWSVRRAIWNKKVTTRQATIKEVLLVWVPRQNQRKECKSLSATKAALNRVRPKWHRQPGHPRALISLLPPWQTSWVTKHRRKRSRRKRSWRRKSGPGLRKSWRRLYLPQNCASREIWRARRRLTRTTSSSGTRSRNFSSSPASQSKLTVRTWTWSPRLKTRYFTSRPWKLGFHSSNSQPGSSQLSTRKWWSNY